MAETPSENTPESTPSESVPRRVECPAAKDPAVRLFILAAMLLGFGIWCLSDLGHYPYKPFSEDANAWLSHMFNKLGAYAFTPLGVVPLVWGIVFLRRKLVADEEGIGYAGRQRARWEDVKELDASRLESKGILTLHCGEGKRLVLDSWKLQNFRQLVALVESRLAPADESSAEESGSSESA